VRDARELEEAHVNYFVYQVLTSMWDNCSQRVECNDGSFTSMN